MIKIVDLHKSYGSKSVLKGINAEFQSGKTYGIIGENGAGKTTLSAALQVLNVLTAQSHQICSR